MAKHTRDSWGSLQYDVKRRKARIRYWAEGPDGYKRRSKTIRNCTRKEAEAARAALMLEHGEDAPCPTVGQLYESDYLPSLKRRLDDGTLAQQSFEIYASTWRNHVRPHWGPQHADMITPLSVQRWLNGVTRNTAVKAMPMLKRILGYATKYGHINSNPFNETYDMPPKSGVRRREDGTYSMDELCDLWCLFWDHWLEAEVMLCAFGSCRVGEALGTRGSDVVALDGYAVPIAAVRIDSQIDGRGRDVERTKNPQSTRWAMLAGAPAKRMVQLARRAGDGYMVSDGVDGHPNQGTVRKWYERIVRGSGMDYHLLKNLRKSWQTIARWKLRIPPQYTEPMMGHLINDVTGIHYDRPDADAFAGVLADAYAKVPFADNLPWHEGRL